MTLLSANKKSSAGFTLLEVLIAMTLMVFISLAIFQATRQSFKVREILSTEGDFYNSIRLAMDVINRDVQSVYSPMAYWTRPTRNPNAQPGADPEQEAILQFPELTMVSKFWQAAIHKSGLRPSIFRGTENTMSFITSSHVRIYKATAESEFMQVSYSTQEIRDIRTNGTTLALFKTQNTNAFTVRDNENGKDQVKFPILEGIEKIRFRYYRAEKEEWLPTWDSTGVDQNNRFPDIVEVAIDVKQSDRLKFTGTYRFRPEVPIHGVPATL